MSDETAPRYDHVVDAHVTEHGPLTEYERGFINGMLAYAWWKDGRMQVGTGGTSLAAAVQRFLESRPPRQPVEAWNEATGEGVDMSRARPDYDPRTDYPERFTEGPI